MATQLHMCEVRMCFRFAIHLPKSRQLKQTTKSTNKEKKEERKEKYQSEAEIN
jgi:hypothetical protein